ncbi:ATP synthase F(0) complex subunit e, mitochondrial-like isoform X2 [Saccoglossus kowalevskii]
MAPAPVVVSPLIKAARYTALFGGIFYGSRRSSSIQKKENHKKSILEADKAKQAKHEAAVSKTGDML